ncbi:T9SS type A sorting domain-containing protein [Tenacibaculum xiamenense]|uniref:T9SS type A sorting domain-containing protein n=1 Tax=Tenacibaculum xiamenense TaxID=1261553 RepID=UPI0038943AF4
MNFKNYLLYIFLIAVNTLSFSQQEFCPGNYFDNGDLEIGTPTGSDQDINLAQGFSAIWGSGSLADFYAFNAGPFTYPAPATGNYAGFWISNHPFPNTTWREGLYNTFLTPIPANTGNYDFTFDVACLYKDSGVDADVEIGVYGIYNPGASLGTTPSSNFTPDNLNLFPGNTVLLGTIPITGDCSNIKQNVSITIATAGMSIPSITHIMITHSDTVISYGDGGGKRYIGLDNFCLTVDDTQPQGETDYCCDSDVNEIRNGNFENGNSGFSSSYSVGTNSLYGTVPGQYYVGTNADGLNISPLWNINDHSSCTIGSTNDEVLFVNGRTTQPSGTESVIYEQNITLGSSDDQEEKKYKLCANFKNMPQATFDILPEIEIRVTGASTYNSGFFTVNTDESDPCDWQLESAVFNGLGNITIQFVLKEDGLGDGNDVAIDDISLQQLDDPAYSITVQHQGNPQEITGSINTIDASDDKLLCDSSVAGQADYFWYVIEVTGYTGGTLTYDITTLGWGNTGSSYVTTPFGSGTGPAWNLTTTFPGYPFDDDTLYLIGLYTPPNPDCCLDEGWTYQLTYNHRSSNTGPVLSEKQKEELKALFGVILDENRNESENLSIYPNPTRNTIYLNTGKQKITKYDIVSVLGKREMTYKSDKNNEVNNIDISKLNRGVYIIKIQLDNGVTVSRKFIKK